MGRGAAVAAAVVVAAGCGGGDQRAAPLKQGCVRVFMKTSATKPQIRAVGDELFQDHRVETVRYISRADALRLMKRRHPELFSDPHMPYNPLPAAFAATPTGVDAGKSLVRSLHPLRVGVDAVKYNRRLRRC